MNQILSFGPWAMNQTCGDSGDLTYCNLTERDLSWNEAVHLLVVDQPVGTGYSYVNRTQDMVNTTEQAVTDLWQALHNLYT